MITDNAGKYWITNGIAVDSSTIERHFDNGLKADQKVTLCWSKSVESPHVEAGKTIWYLETNGDPVLVHEENQLQVAHALHVDLAGLRDAIGEDCGSPFFDERQVNYWVISRGLRPAGWDIWSTEDCEIEHEYKSSTHEVIVFAGGEGAIVNPVHGASEYLQNPDGFADLVRDMEEVRALRSRDSKWRGGASMTEIESLPSNPCPSCQHERGYWHNGKEYVQDTACDNCLGTLEPCEPNGYYELGDADRNP